MLAFVYRPRRYTSDGKRFVSRLYRGRIRLEGEYQTHDIGLETTDKQVAEKKLAERITEMERERAGLIAPRLERESAQKNLLQHAEDFEADLAAIGRSPSYYKTLISRFKRVCKECKWSFPGDVSANSFVSWRAGQNEFSRKTLNEYLNASNAVLNWMVKQGRIRENPIKGVVHVDVRGHQQHRRAFTDAELDRLLAVASPGMRLLYLAAAMTGLRVGELKQVAWGDLHLDEEHPHIVVRASTTKNRKQATLPVHAQLQKELLAIRPADCKQDERVFFQHPHPDRRIRMDMEAAGIERIDPLGRKLDFHSLRYTFATKLAVSGVSQRLTQELMRHSDPRLTANIYTDVTQLPTFDAVNVLPWRGVAEEGEGNASECAQTAKEASKDTAIHSLGIASGCPKVASDDLRSSCAQPTTTVDRQGFSRILAQFAKGRKVLEVRGVENGLLISHCTDNEQLAAQNKMPRIANAIRGKNELVEVAGVEGAWPSFPSTWQYGEWAS